MSKIGLGIAANLRPRPRPRRCTITARLWPRFHYYQQLARLKAKLSCNTKTKNKLKDTCNLTFKLNTILNFFKLLKLMNLIYYIMYNFCYDNLNFVCTIYNPTHSLQYS